MTKFIELRGVRTHNLKNIDLKLPRNRIVVITGVSGSGKSSLAFDTIFAEGQRRYVESLSAYARQFLNIVDKPELDYFSGVSPSIAIDQKASSHNPRSTVGTVTEIHDYLRLLYARVGMARCPKHNTELRAQSPDEMIAQIRQLPRDKGYMLLAVLHSSRKGEYTREFQRLAQRGFARVMINNEIYELDKPPKLDRHFKNDIEVVVLRFRIRDDNLSTLTDSLETAIEVSKGLVRVVDMDKNEELLLSSQHACPYCQFSITELEPRLFSFNSPMGACPECDGLGVGEHINPDRLIVHPELSLRQGAISGWGENKGLNFDYLQHLARECEISVDLPWNELSSQEKKTILYGPPDSETRKHSGRRHMSRRRRSLLGFNGIVNHLNSLHKSSPSQSFLNYISEFVEQSQCKACKGSRLNETANTVYLDNMRLHELCQMPIETLLPTLSKLTIKGAEYEISERIMQEINRRLHFLETVGLGYLSLGRSSNTLSGGEAQRIRLASQIGAGLVGVMYVLDEPSIGLHQKDTRRLLETLKALRDMDNSIIIVEHDEEIIRSADYVVDIGPGAGRIGGEVVATGDPEQIASHSKSLTGQFLSGSKAIAVPATRRKAKRNASITIRNAQLNNLKKITAEFPVGALTCVTGVSGSGKSTLVNETLCRMAKHYLHRSASRLPGSGTISNINHIDKAIVIDQSPIGRTPRSNPATYTGLFTPIRELFAATPDARAHGYKPGRFSFNVSSGVCGKCRGDGVIRVEMHFLSDMYVTCDACDGRRYSNETLEIRFKGHSILDVLNMTVAKAAEVFPAFPTIAAKLQTLQDVGLGYIRLGQSATTLSGGEAQRIKLSRELSKRDTGSTLYILDEPTVGLHFHDVDNLINVLVKLRDRGNTLVIIEHNLDVIKCADWVIDLGPGGGERGGHIVSAGTPEEVAKSRKSHTGQYLRPLLAKSAKAKGGAKRARRAAKASA